MSTEQILSSDGVPLEISLKKAERRNKLRALMLVGPLFLFLLITYVFPIGDMLFRSVDDRMITKMLPNTFTALEQWDGQDLPDEEVYEALESMLEMKTTMGEKVKKFEKLFAEYIGVKYALMVNSGSSANLLALSILSNPILENKRIKENDEIITPAITWSTTVFPIININAKPVFVDIDNRTLNIDIDQIEVGEGESLEDIKAKLKPKKASISAEMLDTANTYDDKVAVIRMIVSDEAGRVSNVFKSMMSRDIG